MGIYSEHWKKYAAASRKATLRMFLLLLLGLPAAALPSVLVNFFTGEYPVLPHIALLVVWLAGFTWVAVRYSRVVCPRCETIYSRGKYLCDCPKCGLRMLQEDP